MKIKRLKIYGICIRCNEQKLLLHDRSNINKDNVLKRPSKNFFQDCIDENVDNIWLSFPLTDEEELALCNLIVKPTIIKPVIYQQIQPLRCHRKIHDKNTPLHIYNDSSDTRKRIRKLVKTQKKDRHSLLYNARDVRRFSQLNHAMKYRVISLC